MTKLSRDGDLVVVRFEPDEVAALRDLAGQLLALLTGGAAPYGADPVRDRLFPRAYLDPTEDAAETDFQSVVHDDLVKAKSETVGALAASLRSGADGRGRVKLTLDPEGVQEWVAALNDVRLAIGVVIGVTEDDPDVDESDPRYAGFATYDWLTWLQGSLVETLLEDT